MKTKKRTGEKPVKKRRLSQKQRTVQSLIVLSIILFLSIILVLLIPAKIKTEKAITHHDPDRKERVENSEENTKEKIIRIKEKQDRGMTEGKGVIEEDEEKGGSITVVIDDAGNNLRDLLPFLQFPGNLSIAVLPQLPYSTEAANLIRESGKEVLLHQPMEPDSAIDPGPGTLYCSQTKEEIISILKKNLATVPGAVGVNNHMGSKFTADMEKMEILLNFFSEQGLNFLDSRTTGQSVSGKVAARIGMPFLQRHIFLDYKPDREVIREQMKKGIELALKNKYVIVIGHVQNSEVLDVLYEFLPELEQDNLSFVGVSELHRGK